MKKYIIDETLVRVITAYCLLRCEENIPDRLAALKPIEPLSDEAINGVLLNKFVYRIDQVEFARAIERHILWETP